MGTVSDRAHRRDPLARRLAGTVRRALREAGLGDGDRLVVAVSGGVDSMVLLHLLAHVAPGMGLRLSAAHLDHGLRPESAADADFVAARCAARGVPLTRARRRVRRRPGESLQAAARRVRYRFLRAAARVLGAAAVATAHHADDLAETVLMRLLAGAGSGALAAMARPRPGLVRPLLEVPKADLVAHARAHDIAFREDATNADPRYLRNRLRRDVVPALRALNPNLAATLGAEARVLADEADFIARAAAEAAKALVRPAPAAFGPDAVALARAGLAGLHPAVARRLVADLVARTVPGRRGADAVAAVLDLSRGPSGRRVDLGGGRTAEARYGLLVLAGGTPGPTAPPDPVPLAVPGLTPVPWAGLALEARRDVPADAPGWVRADLGADPPPLAVRTRRPGDRLHPGGVPGGTRSLKRLLIAREVPRDLRATLPLVVAPEGVVWVVGMRQDPRFVVKGTGDRARRGAPLALRVAPGGPEGPDAGRPGGGARV